MSNMTVRLGLREILALMALAMAFSEVSAQAKKTIQKPVAAKSTALPSTPLSSPTVGGLMVQVQPGSGDCEDGVWNEADSTCNPNNDSPGAGGGGNTLPPVVVTSPPKPPAMPPPPPPSTVPVGGGLTPVIPAEKEKLCNGSRDVCKQRAERIRDIAIAECDRIESKKPGIWSFILETAARMACKATAEAACNKYVDGTCESERQDCLLKP